MKRKHIIILIFVIIIILILVSSWIVYSKYIKKPVQDELPVNDPVTGDVIPAAGISQSFPLRKGMSGPMISEAQIAVNKKCNANLVPDGKFGPLTESAISKCYGTGVVSESIYTQMKIDSTATTCPAGQYKGPNGKCVFTGYNPGAVPFVVSTDLKKGDGVVSKVPELVLFSAPSGNSSIGKIPYLTTSKQIGIYEEKLGEFSKLWLNLSYVKNNGMMGAAPAWVYVYTSLIKKK